MRVLVGIILSIFLFVLTPFNDVNAKGYDSSVITNIPPPNLALILADQDCDEIIANQLKQNDGEGFCGAYNSAILNINNIFPHLSEKQIKEKTYTIVFLFKTEVNPNAP